MICDQLIFYPSRVQGPMRKCPYVLWRRRVLYWIQTRRLWTRMSCWRITRQWLLWVGCLSPSLGANQRLELPIFFLTYRFASQKCGWDMCSGYTFCAHCCRSELTLTFWERKKNPVLGTVKGLPAFATAVKDFPYPSGGSVPAAHGTIWIGPELISAFAKPAASSTWLV